MEENDVGKRWAGALSQVEGLGLPLGLGMTMGSRGRSR